MGSRHTPGETQHNQAQTAYVSWTIRMRGPSFVFVLLSLRVVVFLSCLTELLSDLLPERSFLIFPEIAFKNRLSGRQSIDRLLNLKKRKSPLKSALTGIVDIRSSVATSFYGSLSVLHSLAGPAKRPDQVYHNSLYIFKYSATYDVK